MRMVSGGGGMDENHLGPTKHKLLHNESIILS